MKENESATKNIESSLEPTNYNIPKIIDNIDLDVEMMKKTPAKEEVKKQVVSSENKSSKDVVKSSSTVQHSTPVKEVAKSSSGEQHSTSTSAKEGVKSSSTVQRSESETSKEEKVEETDSKNSYISDMIDKKIDEMTSSNNEFGVGRVVKIKDFILEVVGLDNVSFYERVNIANKATGYVTKMETNCTVVALLVKNDSIHIGDEVYQTNEEFMGEYSDESIGRVIDIFGRDKLNNKKYQNTHKLHIEKEPVPIMDRREVNRPLETGIAGIDLIYPIGKGQRQLIIGDKKTGKTQICLDTIVNQAGKNMICIFVAIGKTKKEVKEIYYELLKRNVSSYTIMITAFYDDLPTILYLTPYFALSVANYYMEQGKDVLVVIDDLKKHADAYREISLISEKSPGRDAYPADIFYSHSRMLEKGCQHKNGGSVTVLPIVETKGGDITDYISTNIISITDGQIVLSSKSFKKGEKPAINYGLSVSRLGGAVQTKEMKELGSKVRRKLLSYLETRDIYELANVDEMSKELQEKLFLGQKILENLKQYKFSPQNIDDIKKNFSFLEDVNND